MYEPDAHPLEFLRECILLGRRWRVRLDERLRQSGMTAARLTVLYWVSNLPEGTSQREIADTVGIEGPTLVRQLHALEAQGLIARVPLLNDRRAKGIRPTEAGAAVLDDLYKVAEELSVEHLAKLEKRRLPSAIRLARQAREALE